MYAYFNFNLIIYYLIYLQFMLETEEGTCS